MTPFAVWVWVFVAVPVAVVIGCAAFGLTPTLWAFAGLSLALWLAEIDHFLNADNDMARSMEMFNAIIFAGPPTIAVLVLGVVKLALLLWGWLGR